MGIAGSILLILSAWIDCADGEVARLKFMTPEWESKLDIVSDNIVYYSFFCDRNGTLFFRKPYWVRKQRRQQSFLWGLAIRKFQIN